MLRWRLSARNSFELARDAIRVNPVLPGVVMTPQLKRRRDANPDGFDHALDAIPQGRFLEAAEIAGPVMFFLSPASSACTGGYLLADGGMHIGSPSPPAVCFRNRRSAP